MKFTESIKKNSHFREIYKKGISYGNKYLVIYVLENGTSSNRIGISVSKKVGNSVVRHRLTRLVRESFRLNEYKLNKDVIIVVVVRIQAKNLNFSEIQGSFLHLCKLYKILKEMV